MFLYDFIKLFVNYKAMLNTFLLFFISDLPCCVVFLESGTGYMSEDGGSPRPDTMDVDSPSGHINPTPGITKLLGKI